MSPGTLLIGMFPFFWCQNSREAGSQERQSNNCPDGSIHYYKAWDRSITHEDRRTKKTEERRAPFASRSLLKDESIGNSNKLAESQH